MFSGTYPYLYSTFRADLRAIGDILEQKRILRLTGEWWDAADYEGGDYILPLKVGSYFAQRYKENDQSMELYSVYMMALSRIEEHIEVFAPGREFEELIESGFDLASEPLLQAVHALCTEVDMAEWGDGREETLEFLVEMARSRFGYEG